MLRRIINILTFIVIAPFLLFFIHLLGYFIAEHFELSKTILLRTSLQYKDDKLVKAQGIQTWRLELPRPVDVHYNVYGTWIDRNILGAFDPKWSFGSLVFEKNSDTYQSVSVLSGVDPSTDQIVARGTYWQPKFKGTPTLQFGFTFKNKPILKQLAQNEFCVYGEEYSYKRRDAINSGMCVQDNPTCSFIINYKGWLASAVVSKEYFRQQSKKEMCKIARSQIDAWTVQVDDLRIK